MRFFPVLVLALVSLGAASRVLAAAVSAEIRDTAGQPVADAVISLVPLDAPAPATPPAVGVEIIQANEQYRPYVTPVRAGTEIVFPNNDKIQHHIYSVSKAKPFEKPLYDSGERETVLFDRPGVVTLGCNIHDWMVAYVVVLDTPYFAQTSAAGVARVAELPAGRYRLEVWHPRISTPFAREVTLEKDATLAEAVSLRLKPDRRIRRAPVGESKTY